MTFVLNESVVGKTKDGKKITRKARTPGKLYIRRI